MLYSALSETTPYRVRENDELHVVMKERARTVMYAYELSPTSFSASTGLFFFYPLPPQCVKHF